MIAGFTGATSGMTAEQAEGLDILLARLGVTELHQGGCVGADQHAAALAEEHGIAVHTHPHDEDDGTHGVMPPGEIRYPPAEWRARNEAIADVADLLIAAPWGPRPRSGSGTWHAIDAARDRDMPVILLAWTADREPS